MFDVGVQEILLVAVVAIIAIGPKDMPLALRSAGRWIGKMRRMSGQFRTGLDSMIREAEMEDMEKKWAAQNEKVMAEHPDGVPDDMEPTGAYPAARSGDVSGSAEAGVSPEDALSNAGARPAGTTDAAAKKAADKAAKQAAQQDEIEVAPIVSSDVTPSENSASKVADLTKPAAKPTPKATD